MEEEYQYRLTKIDYGCLLFTAIFFDSTQALLDIIPLIGWIASSFVALIAFMTFWLWLKIKNVGIFDKGVRMLATWAITPILELTFSFVPGLTVMIMITYYIVRADDELDKRKILSREKQDEWGEWIHEHKDKIEEYV